MTNSPGRGDAPRPCSICMPMRRRSNLSVPKFQFIHDCFPSFSRIRYRPKRERERDAGSVGEQRGARRAPTSRPRSSPLEGRLEEDSRNHSRHMWTDPKADCSFPEARKFGAEVRAGNYGSARSRRGGDIRGASSMNRTTPRVTKSQREEHARRSRISSRNKLAEGADSPPMKIRSDPKLLERVQPDISQARRESDARVRHVENFRVAR